MKIDNIFNNMTNIYFMEDYYNSSKTYCPYKIYTLDRHNRRKYFYSEIFYIIGKNINCALTYIELLVKQCGVYYMFSILPSGDRFVKYCYNSSELVEEMCRVNNEYQLKIEYLTKTIFEV